MKQRAPSYYNEFKCIAGKCKNNCCKAGWEINIDTETANFYKNVKNDFSKKLNENIDIENGHHFILNKNGICPFLNSKNLCEIYTNLGEKNMCQICKDHPRFYEWFNGVKECGIGLCCEEACRIIIANKNKFSIQETEIPLEKSDNYDETLYSYLLNCREKIINYLDNSSNNIKEKTKNILWYTHTIQQDIDYDLLDEEEIFEIKNVQKTSLKEVILFLSELNPNDKNWPNYLKNSLDFYNDFLNNYDEFKSKNPEINLYLKNISIYFLWRYFLKGTFDEEVLSKVKLMAVSIAILEFLFFYEWQKNKKITLENCIEITRKYSEEIEYSQENLDNFFEESYNLQFLDTEYLMGLFVK